MHSPVLVPALMAVLLLSACQSTPPPVPAASPPDWKALGTEPFWGFTLRGSDLVYSTPENQAGDRIVVIRNPAAGGEDVTGELAGQPFRAEIREGSCSDGMSDMRYAWRVALTVGGETRKGCARLP